MEIDRVSRYLLRRYFTRLKDVEGLKVRFKLFNRDLFFVQYSFRLWEYLILGRIKLYV